jgi:hypothetical protein
MNEANGGLARKFLLLAAISEIGVGLAALLLPAFFFKLLLGVELSADGILAGRSFGIALLALQFACWPGAPSGEGGPKVLLGLMTYNVLFTFFLAYLGTVGGIGGWLLWPAVAFHAIVSVVLMRFPRDGNATRAGS